MKILITILVASMMASCYYWLPQMKDYTLYIDNESANASDIHVDSENRELNIRWKNDFSARVFINSNFIANNGVMVPDEQAKFIGKLVDEHSLICTFEPSFYSVECINFKTGFNSGSIDISELWSADNKQLYITFIFEYPGDEHNPPRNVQSKFRFTIADDE